MLYIIIDNVKQLTAINKFLALASVILFSTHLSQAFIVGESVTILEECAPTLVGLSGRSNFSLPSAKYALHPISKQHGLALIPQGAEITKALFSSSGSYIGVKPLAILKEIDHYKLVLYELAFPAQEPCFSLLNEEEDMPPLEQEISIITIGDCASLPQRSSKSEKVIDLKDATVFTKKNRTFIKVPFESNNVLLEATDVGAAFVKKCGNRNILLGLALENNRKAAESSTDAHHSYFLSLTPGIMKKIKELTGNAVQWIKITSKEEGFSLPIMGTGFPLETGATNSLKPQTAPKPCSITVTLPSWEKCSYAQLREYIEFNDGSHVFYDATNDPPKKALCEVHGVHLVYPHGVTREEFQNGRVEMGYPGGLRFVREKNWAGYTASNIGQNHGYVDSLKYLYLGGVIEFFDSTTKLVWIFYPNGGKLSINWENGLAKSYSDSGNLLEAAYLFGKNKAPRGYLAGENELWGLKLVVPKEKQGQSQAKGIRHKESSDSLLCNETLEGASTTSLYEVAQIIKGDGSIEITYPTGLQLIKENGQNHYICSQIPLKISQDTTKEHTYENGIKESYNCKYGSIQLLYPNGERLIIDCKKGTTTLFGENWAPIARGFLFGNEGPRVYLGGNLKEGLRLIFEPSEINMIQGKEKEKVVGASQAVGIRKSKESTLGCYRDLKDSLTASYNACAPRPMDFSKAPESKEKELETRPGQEKEPEQPVEDSLQMNIEEKETGDPSTKRVKEEEKLEGVLNTNLASILCSMQKELRMVHRKDYLRILKKYEKLLCKGLLKLTGTIHSQEEFNVCYPFITEHVNAFVKKAKDCNQKVKKHGIGPVTMSIQPFIHGTPFALPGSHLHNLFKQIISKYGKENPQILAEISHLYPSFGPGNTKIFDLCTLIAEDKLLAEKCSSQLLEIIQVNCPIFNLCSSVAKDKRLRKECSLPLLEILRANYPTPDMYDEPLEARTQKVEKLKKEVWEDTSIVLGNRVTIIDGLQKGLFPPKLNEAAQHTLETLYKALFEAADKLGGKGKDQEAANLQAACKALRSQYPHLHSVHQGREKEQERE